MRYKMATSVRAERRRTLEVETLHLKPYKQRARMQDPFVQSGEHCTIQPGAIVGLRYKEGCKPVVVGSHAHIRAYAVVYADVVAGDYFQTGHHVLIRENCVFGHHTVIGTNTVIDGYVVAGDFVKIESNCYVPTHVRIGSRVFIGPGVVLTNDRYPLKMRDAYRPEGPVIEDGVTIGAGSVVAPGVTIGEGSFVAAGSVVTKDIPSMCLVKGVPGTVHPLPEKLRERNVALSWRGFLSEHD